MTAAIACPGPSLLDTFPGREGFKAVACVNRAATVIRPDVWAALDLPLILTTSPHVPTCKLLTGDNTLASLQRRHHLRAERVVTTESLACPVPRWSGYSATAALVYLASIGAMNVRVYGADWVADAPDFDGVRGGDNRGAGRFADERGIWDATAAWLAGRGVRVERV